MSTASQSRSAASAITIGLTSLADGGYRSSAHVDNAVNLYLDAQLAISIQVGAVTADGTISIFAYGSTDAGATYDGGLDGTDLTVTWGTTPASSSVQGFNQLKLLAVASVDTTDDNNDIELTVGSVAAAFGGILPERWGVVILNESGVALNATGGNNKVEYVGIKYESA